MKLLGRTFSQLIVLQPIGLQQRKILGALSGIAVLVVLTQWGYTGPAAYQVWWHELPTNTGGLIGELSAHLAWSTVDILRGVFASDGTPLGQLASIIWLVFNGVPTVVGAVLAGSAVLMVLGATGIMRHPMVLHKIGPSILGFVVIVMLSIAALVPPVFEITRALTVEYHAFSLNVVLWLQLFIDMLFQLLVPIAVLLVSLVPIYAPEAPTSKRK